MTFVTARTILGVAAIIGLGAGSLWVNIEQRFARASIPASVQPIVSGPIARDFALCGTGGGTNCVVDGDTIWLDGEKIRLADIDAPETHRPRCETEAALGAQTTLRLQTLVNDGPFVLHAAGKRDVDPYGRKLRILMRNDESLGEILVGEGLARRWDGSRHPWC